MPALILTLADLYSRVGSAKINGYFDDSYNGVLDEETAAVQDVLMAAEGAYFAKMLRAFPGNPTDPGHPLITLANNDAVVRMHLSWAGVELACERRPAFCDAEGWGAYKMQYARAMQHFEDLAKGINRSSGGTLAGVSANTGGSLQPKDTSGNVQPFVFAASRDKPSGTGGF